MVCREASVRAAGGNWHFRAELVRLQAENYLLNGELFFSSATVGKTG